MNKEFDFIDLYYLNDISNKPITEDLSFMENPELESPQKYIRIMDTDNIDTVTYTYDKFIEILDTQGLEGLTI